MRNKAMFMAIGVSLAVLLLAGFPRAGDAQQANLQSQINNLNTQLNGLERLPMTVSGTIAGKVECSTTDTPVAGEIVYIAGHSFSAITDGSGNFVINFVPPGTYSLTVSWPLVSAQVPNVKVKPQGTVTVPTIYVTCAGCTGNPDGTPCSNGPECTTNYKCVNGMCEGTPEANCCPAGQTSCSTGCVNEQTDFRNCGACGNVCFTAVSNAIPDCVSGVCGFTCIPGTSECAGACVNEPVDVNNCGACGHVCPSVTNGAPTCIAGACGIASCNPGYYDCNSACVNVMTDPSNCGACGNVCEFTCTGGSCTGS